MKKTNKQTADLVEKELLEMKKSYKKIKANDEHIELAKVLEHLDNVFNQMTKTKNAQEAKIFREHFKEHAFLLHFILKKINIQKLTKLTLKEKVIDYPFSIPKLMWADYSGGKEKKRITSGVKKA